MSQPLSLISQASELLITEMLGWDYQSHFSSRSGFVNVSKSSSSLLEGDELCSLLMESVPKLLWVTEGCKPLGPQKRLLWGPHSAQQCHWICRKML